MSDDDVSRLIPATDGICLVPGCSCHDDQYCAVCDEERPCIRHDIAPEYFADGPPSDGAA